MKCEACLHQLEEFIDGELGRGDAQQISAHLVTCAGCSRAFDQLAAEQEVYGRYDRALEISPALWPAIEGRIGSNDSTNGGNSRFEFRQWLAGLFVAPRFGLTFAGAMALVIAALVIGVVYLRVQKELPTQIVKQKKAEDSKERVAPELKPLEETGIGSKPQRAGVQNAKLNQGQKRFVSRKPIRRSADQSDVLYSDIAVTDAEDVETQKHIERAQMLLRSIRNVEVSKDDTAVDVSYEKALSRQLLSENIVLRRDAETNGKFPIKTLLGSLEPFLIDIANLQDRATPDDLLAIKDRVRKTEIVAVLQSY